MRVFSTQVSPKAPIGRSLKLTTSAYWALEIHSNVQSRELLAEVLEFEHIGDKLVKRRCCSTSLSSLSIPHLIMSGNISINFGVDREAQSQFTVTVVATDQGTPSLSRSGNLTVFVDDINDSPPYFLTDYNADVLENETVGAPVARVSALDDDIGVNAISTYR